MSELPLRDGCEGKIGELERELEREGARGEKSREGGVKREEDGGVRREEEGGRYVLEESEEKLLPCDVDIMGG